jgi:hypothetical protein
LIFESFFDEIQKICAEHFFIILLLQNNNFDIFVIAHLMEQKKEFIKLIRQSSDKGNDTLTELVVRIASKPHEFNFDEVCELLSSAEHDYFWSSVQVVCTELLNKLDSESEEGEGVFEEIVASLRPIANLILHFITTFRFRPNPLLTSMQSLHDILIPLEETVPGARDLKNTISKFCEQCWHGNEEGAEALVPQLVPYLLLTALEPDSPDANVKRLYSIRDTLCLLDYEDSSIQTIQGLLLRCFVDTKFLRVSPACPLVCIFRTKTCFALSCAVLYRLLKVVAFSLLFLLFIKVPTQTQAM